MRGLSCAGLSSDLRNALGFKVPLQQVAVDNLEARVCASACKCMHVVDGPFPGLGGSLIERGLDCLLLWSRVKGFSRTRRSRCLSLLHGLHWYC